MQATTCVSDTKRRSQNIANAMCEFALNIISHFKELKIGNDDGISSATFPKKKYNVLINLINYEREEGKFIVQLFLLSFSCWKAPWKFLDEFKKI